MTFQTLQNQFDEQSSQSPAWLQSLQSKSWQQFLQKGLPTRKDEEWRYTSMRGLEELNLDLSANTDATAWQNQINELTAPFAQSIVFVNGWYSKEFSKTADQKAVRVLLGQDALQDTFVKQTLQSHASKNVFDDLNKAFLNDVTLIRIQKDSSVKEPVLVLHVRLPHQQKNKNQFFNPHHFIYVEAGAKASVLEQYTHFDGAEDFTNSQSHIYIENNACLEHVICQQESTQAFHVGHTNVQQQAGSQFYSFTFDFGGRLVRRDLDIALQEENSFAQLNGLYVLSGEQHVDNHTSVDHQKPHTNSHQLIKGILKDKGHAVFNGKVFIREDAQHVDAQQLNKNLLLSEKAQVDTKPQLEISADDVSCAHGATIGQISGDELFYLKSRGISEQDAKTLLISGFADDVFNTIQNDFLRTRLKEIFSRGDYVGHGE